MGAPFDEINPVRKTYFINASEQSVDPSDDEGFVAQLEDDGKIHPVFQSSPYLSNGEDGDIEITSGNTDIDCGGEQLVVKNYLDILITGTASLSFSNPHANGTTVILLCRNLTVTSSANPAIDASGMGGDGGEGNTTSVTSDTKYGTDGSDGLGISDYKTNKGLLGDIDVSIPGGDTPTEIPFIERAYNLYRSLFPFLIPGAGGGGGSLKVFNPSVGLVTSGGGGRGGGALAILCSGKWNVTSNISVAGDDGVDGAGAGTFYASGGGGGGGGGTFFGLFKKLVANSGLVNISGGAGGTASAVGSTGISKAGGTGAGSVKESGSTATNNGGDGGDGFEIRTDGTDLV